MVSEEIKDQLFGEMTATDIYAQSNELTRWTTELIQHFRL